MKGGRKIVWVAMAAMLAVTACNKTQPTPKTEFPAQYTLGYEEHYGHFYDSVPYAVVALDLYSDGITLNKDHRIQGTGYNLYLSDIFVPDSLLTEGTYHSDSTAKPFTFIPGHDYEGTPHGMYILQIEDSKIASIQVLDSGTFTYQHDSLLFTLYYTNPEGYLTTYRPSFSAPLIPWPEK